MTSKLENSILHRVYLMLERMKTGTIREIAAACDLSESQVTNAVDRLMKTDKAHVSSWNHTETSRCAVRIIKLGRGVNVRRSHLDFGECEIVNMREHKRFLKNFVPHPDVAAQWLFNEPKVELLGAKHD
jgi:hypothetical protein